MQPAALLVIDVQQGLDDDAYGTHYSAEQMHSVNLASLHGEFCMVRTTAEVLETL